jgi:hypothetical protein
MHHDVRMKRLILFLVTTIITVGYALIGSIIGHFLGALRGVMLGGLLGGVVGVYFSAWVAAQRSWIRPDDRYRTVLGGEIGFVLAASISLKTLSSPIGPLLSSLLIGIGAVIGASLGARKRTTPPQT